MAAVDLQLHDFLLSGRPSRSSLKTCRVTLGPECKGSNGPLKMRGFHTDTDGPALRRSNPSLRKRQRFNTLELQKMVESHFEAVIG